LVTFKSSCLTRAAQELIGKIPGFLYSELNNMSEFNVALTLLFNDHSPDLPWLDSGTLNDMQLISLYL